jgi:hypothetical protein
LGSPLQMTGRRRAWAKLEENRIRAAEFSLDILVWGPAQSDSLEYRKRVEIRDALREDGHNADFSEDLLPPDPPPDPLQDELFQVDAANLVVVLYGSRGTQTEVDRLLSHSQFAEKALVFLTPETLAAALGSVSQATWKTLQKVGQVFEYTTAQLEACWVVGKACEEAQVLRRAAYAATVLER